MIIRQFDGSAPRLASRKSSGAQEAALPPHDRLELSSDRLAKEGYDPDYGCEWKPLPPAPVFPADSRTPALQETYGVILGCGVAGQVIGAAAGYLLTGSAWVGFAGSMGGGLLGATVGALIAP